MGTDQRFSLRWNNYQSHLVTAFESLMEEKEFVDVTLGVEGKKLPAHKMLLSACSPYFRELLKGNQCSHPIIVLRDVKYDDLTSLLQFMYNGEVNVAQEQLNSFLKTAESLKIRGLTDNEEGEPEAPRPPVRDRLADNAPDESPPPPKKMKRPHSDTQTLPVAPTPPPARLPTPKHVHPPPRPTQQLPPQPVKQEIIDIGDEGDIAEDNGYVNDSDRGDGTVANISAGYEHEEYDETALAVPDGSMDASQDWGGDMEGWKYTYGNAMDHHMLPCPECPRKFSSKNALSNHLPAHQGRTTCRDCGKPFSSLSNLNKHIRKNHPEQLQPPMAGPPSFIM